MKINYSPKDLLLLSNYLDGQLSTREVLLLEKRFEIEPALIQALNELRQTRYLLQHVRKVPVPHHFTLTPEMAEQIRPARKPLFPFFSFASVIATVLLVVVILFDFLPGMIAGTSSSKSASDAILAMEAAPMASPLMAEEVVGSSEAPQIFEWGQPHAKGPSGMGGAEVGLMAVAPANVEIENGSEIPELPAEEPDPNAANERGMMKQADVEPITGSGPIHGVRTDEETAAFNESVLRDLSASAEEQILTLSNPFPWLRVSQIILALIAICSAITAIVLRKGYFSGTSSLPRD